MRSTTWTGIADRARLVGDSALAGLPNPPGRVRRELEPALPLELLDRADQPEHALLDQVEEGEALVAVVLGDRDDEPQVRLDHAALGRHVAPLDALGELDLVGGRQQGMTPDLAQEELQRIGRDLGGRLDVGPLRRLGGLRRLGRLRLDDLDRSLLELADQRLDVVWLELGRLGRGLELALVDESRGLCRLEKQLKLLVLGVLVLLRFRLRQP